MDKAVIPDDLVKLIASRANVPPATVRLGLREGKTLPQLAKPLLKSDFLTLFRGEDIKGFRGSLPLLAWLSSHPHTTEELTALTELALSLYEEDDSVDPEKVLDQYRLILDYIEVSPRQLVSILLLATRYGEVRYLAKLSRIVVRQLLRMRELRIEDLLPLVPFPEQTRLLGALAAALTDVPFSGMEFVVDPVETFGLTDEEWYRYNEREMEEKQEEALALEKSYYDADFEEILERFKRGVVVAVEEGAVDPETVYALDIAALIRATPSDPQSFRDFLRENAKWDRATYGDLGDWYEDEDSD